MKLKLYNRDEIFLVNLDTVLYFKAEDHYTSVYYAKDTKQFLPFGLSQLEEAIKNQTIVVNLSLEQGVAICSILKRWYMLAWLRKR